MSKSPQPCNNVLVPQQVPVQGRQSYYKNRIPVMLNLLTICVTSIWSTGIPVATELLTDKLCTSNLFIFPNLWIYFSAFAAVFRFSQFAPVL